MRTIWHSLAWKEWHEHKWKLVSLAAIVLGVILTVRYAYVGDRDQNLMLAMPVSAVMCLLPLALYVAAKDATGEQSAGTAQFLKALPILQRQVAVSKLTFGMMACLTPLVIIMATLFISLFLHPDAATGRLQHLPFPLFPTQNLQPRNIWCALVLGLSAAAVGSIYLWTIALAASRKDEVSGAAISLATIVGIWTCYGYLISNFFPNSSQIGLWDMANRMIGSALPGGFALMFSHIDENTWSHWVPCAVAATLSHGVLIAWFIYRFSNDAGVAAYSRIPQGELASAHRGLAPPHRSKFVAIIWKQLREIGPTLIIGIAAALAIIAPCLFSDWKYYGEGNRAFDLAIGVVCYVGFIVVLTIGVGMFLNELAPGLNTFWRSRPINPSAWYWTRYFVTPAVLLALIGAPIVTLYGWRLLVSLFDASIWRVDFRPAVGVIIMSFAVYSTAIAMTCLVRQAIYAAVLAICALIAPFFFVWSLWRIASRIGWLTAPAFGPLDSFAYWAVMSIAGVTAVVASLVGWLALRNDWGRKS